MTILLYMAVMTGYWGLALWAWSRAVQLRPVAVNAWIGDPGAASAPSSSFALPERVLVVVIWAIHFRLLGDALFSEDGLRFGFALGLSATLWLAVAVFWIESLFYALQSMRLLILPLAGLCALLPAWFPGSTSVASAANTVGLIRSPAFDAHIVVALCAYGLLTIAALHAMLMASLERWLHRSDRDRVERSSTWSVLQGAVLGQLPALMTMERLLFQIVGAGFALLTLTVLTGIVFSEALFGRPMQFDHKTVFSLLAWVIFGALLVGRVGYGWRGRMALRWTLSGFVALVLAYVGSRFVLEVILHRV